MLIEVSGDLLLSQAQAIAHGVAPHDHFETGLAHHLRELWPAMYKDFRHFCHTQNPNPGAAWMWGGTGGKRIVALFTQEQSAAHHHQGHPGRAKIEHVNHALRELRKLVEREHFSSLALSRLATGVGGLAWEEVQPLVQKHLGDLKIPVYIYSTFHSGVAAVEPGVPTPKAA